VLREQRQSGRRRVTTVGQQVDDRGMDLSSTGRRELARCELADLLVGEGVVRRLARRLREQQTSPDGGDEVVGQRIAVITATR
jgi:hypothetical protein